MPRPSQPSFDHEASLEELAGVGKNRRFDEVIDDEESEDIQVICKRGTEEIPVAKPSRAFYFGDRNLYDQEAKRFDQEEKARILNTDQFPRYFARFSAHRRNPPAPARMTLGLATQNRAQVSRRCQVFRESNYDG